MKKWEVHYKYRNVGDRGILYLNNSVTVSATDEAEARSKAIDEAYNLHGHCEHVTPTEVIQLSSVDRRGILIAGMAAATTLAAANPTATIDLSYKAITHEVYPYGYNHNRYHTAGGSHNKQCGSDRKAAKAAKKARRNNRRK